MTNTISVLLVASAFIGMGTIALIRPALIMKLVDGSAATINSRNEIRAVYGGFGICLGLLLVLIEPMYSELSKGVYLASGVALAGMAVGRLISVFIERPGLLPWFYMLIESAAACLLFAELM